MLLGLALTAAATCAPQEPTDPPPAPRLPNVVILYADDMGFGDLHANQPDGKIPTPNLDRLAAAGLRCTDAHSSSGICTPSRYALLTGRHHWPQFHDIVDSFDQPVLLPGRLTIAGAAPRRPVIAAESSGATAVFAMKWRRA